MHNEKNALRLTQTLRAGCSKAEPNFFAPPQTPFQGARDGQKLISWRWSLPLPTNPASAHPTRHSIGHLGDGVH